MRIAQAEATDFPALARIFYDGVHVGAAQSYTATQRAAWAPKVPADGPWRAKFADQAVFVAYDPNPVGFMSLVPETGFVDMAYVAPDVQGKGVAFRLHTHLTHYAQSVGISRLTTHASHVAKPFFERQGWQVEAKQSVERMGVTLENFRMWLDLA